MREAGATSTQAWNVPSEGLLAPPGVVMVAPQTLLRKAEGTQSKGRVELPGGLNNAANNMGIIKAGAPYEPRPDLLEEPQ